MKGNWLKYLGLLGFLGLLGYFTSNTGFYGFFGFFGFFGFSKMTDDERMHANINKAARNAFVVSILIYAITMVWGAVIDNYIVMSYGFAINFAITILVFSFSFQYYDHTGE